MLRFICKNVRIGFSQIMDHSEALLQIFTTKCSLNKELNKYTFSTLF